MARITSLLVAVVTLVLGLYNVTLRTMQIRTVAGLGMTARWGDPVGVGSHGRIDRRGDAPGRQQPPPVVPDAMYPYDTFSVCLLWMDDNFRLTEWIAYHYYMMNLRYLVIHTDPKSRTTPHPVLERWKDRITIEVWDNATMFSNKTYYYRSDNEANETDGTPLAEIIRLRSGSYVERQVDFFQACAMHLRAEGRKWVSFHDSDEFIVVRPQANVSLQELDTPGVVARIVNRYARGGSLNGSNSRNINTTANISEQQLQDWHSWFSQKPCFVLPRALFSAINSSDEDVSKGVPTFLDARQFETFAWRHQGTWMGGSDGPGKAIIDVSRLPNNATSLTGDAEGPHRPFGDLCTHSWRTANSLPLLIHHYLGSWEAFSYRDDVRKGLTRSIEKWRDQSTWNNGGINDEARTWIRGFVAMVGEEAAKRLLKDAGLHPGAKKSVQETNEWTLKGEDAW